MSKDISEEVTRRKQRGGKHQAKVGFEEHSRFMSALNSLPGTVEYCVGGDFLNVRSFVYTWNFINNNGRVFMGSKEIESLKRDYLRTATKRDSPLEETIYQYVQSDGQSDDSALGFVTVANPFGISRGKLPLGESLRYLFGLTSGGRPSRIDSHAPVYAGVTVKGYSVEKQ